MGNDDRLFTIKGLARELGVNPDTVRYWTKCGLPFRRRGGLWIRFGDYEGWRKANTVNRPTEELSASDGLE